VERGTYEWELTPRQEAVLRAVIQGYVGEAGPIGSSALSHRLPTKLSSASIRNTLAELADLGLVDQPHASAGRVPTEAALRLFIDRMVASPRVSDYDRRAVDFCVGGADGPSVAHAVSQLLSEHTSLLGFVTTPRIDQVALQHVALVRAAHCRVAAVLVSTTGVVHRRIVHDEAALDQRQLDKIAALLNERVVGRTLPEVRDALVREAQDQRRQMNRLLEMAIELGSQALKTDRENEDLVIATRLALLDQPEFRDPERIRELFEAIEAKERVLDVVSGMLENQGVNVALGGEVDDPALRRCALVASRYGDDSAGGAIGVIGPSRMDYGRVIALVDYVAHVMSEKLES
jgi:heat-inducible transcriptional repressor